jgi:hypothetical protein
MTAFPACWAIGTNTVKQSTRTALTKEGPEKRGMEKGGLGGLARPPSWSANRIFVGEGGSGYITVAVLLFLARELKLSFLVKI